MFLPASNGVCKLMRQSTESAEELIIRSLFIRSLFEKLKLFCNNDNKQVVLLWLQ